MSKRLRNDEEERDSPRPSEKKHQDDDDDDDGGILALLLLDGPATTDQCFTALLTDSDSDLSFFSFYETNDDDDEDCATMLSSYVTINGNDETCGSSYSDWSSSVMAGFSFSGGGDCTPRASDESGGVNGYGDEDDVSLAFLSEVLLLEPQ